MKNVSLTVKLLTGLLVIMTVGAAFGVFGVVSVLRNALEEEIGRKTSLFAQSGIRDIDRIIFHRIENLTIYAQDLAHEPVLLESNEEFAALGEQDAIDAYIVERDDAWKAAGATATPFMRALIENDLSEEIRDEFELRAFYEAKYGHPLFNEVFVTNRYGANAAQSARTSDYYQADEAWWQGAAERGIFVGDVVFDESAEVFAIELAARVESERGEFLGVVKSLLNIEDVIDVARELADLQRAFGTSAHLELLTADGRAFFSSNKESEFFEDMSDTPLWRRVAAYIEGAPGALPYFVGPGDEEGEGEEFFVFARSEGYRDFAGLGWIILLEQETDQIFASVSRATYAMGAAIGAFILIVLLASWLFLERAVVAPVRKLTDIAERIAGGDADAKAPADAGGEFGVLGGAFNVMTEKLRGYYRDLEREVKERTDELASAKKAQEEKIIELERVNRIMVDRELEMADLKRALERQTNAGAHTPPRKP